MLMMRNVLACAAAAVVLTAVPRAHGGHGDDDRFGVGSFRQVGTFNVPGATSAEIVSATRDGKYLVYSDAIGKRFGLVDIRNPRPAAAGRRARRRGRPDQRGGPSRRQSRRGLRATGQADSDRSVHFYEGG